jgi:acyl-CoA synthetase (AMP-forming)/AMP-acid ligase II
LLTWGWLLMTHLGRPSATITEALRGHARAMPDRPAFRFLPAASAGIELTFAQLDSAATKVAGLLRSRVRAGDRILMFYPPGLDFVVAFVGVLYAGAIAVPLVPPRRRGASQVIKSLIENAEPAAVLTSSHLESRIRHILTDLNCPLAAIATDTAAADESTGDDAATPPPDAACVLQYTSGSTGTPRGVIVTHGNAARNARLLASQCDLDCQSVWVSWVPHFHDLGLFGGICTPLYSGITSVLMPPAAFVTRPVRWLEAIAQHGGTTSIAPNFAYDLCVHDIEDEDCIGLDLSRWTVAGCGAEPIRMETLNGFAERFSRYGLKRGSVCPFYGLAEATLLVSGGPVGLGQTCLNVSLAELRQNRLAQPEASQDCYAVPSSGRPSPEHRILIVDPETNRCCPPNAIGEIWIDGSTTGPGYWRNSTETARVFGARLASGEGPFLRTGDLGFLRDGVLYVTGRIKDVMIIRGQNIYPQDLEATARAAVPNAGEAAAFALADRSTERAVLIIEAPKPIPTDPSPLLEAVRMAVSASNGIDLEHVVLTDRRALPKTSSGKIQRSRARVLLLDGSLPVIAEWRVEDETSGKTPEHLSDHLDIIAMLLDLRQQTEVEQVRSITAYLRNVFDQLLGLKADDLDQGETLIAMGVTSLGIMRIRTRIETDLMIRLEQDLFWQDLSFANLAIRLRRSVLASPLWTNADAVERLAGEIAGMSDEDVARELGADAA